MGCICCKKSFVDQSTKNEYSTFTYPTGDIKKITFFEDEFHYQSESPSDILLTWDENFLINQSNFF